MTNTVVTIHALVLASVLLLHPSAGWTAGGVVGEPGSCMIEIGVYTAHFTVYQSDSSGEEEFCEDLPATGKTLFVLDYLHGSMKEVPVDFRIIEDREDWGIFTRWDNVKSIPDIDDWTVFYQPPTVYPGDQLQAEYDFLDSGGYIGIVTAPHPTKDIVYRAVFPFQVGKIDFMPWLMMFLAAMAAGFYWHRQQR